MKRWMTIWATLLLAVVGQGQDIHFSQVDADPVLLNPAYSGFYEGVGRFGMVYRNQWASVSIPYQTLAVSGEMALWRGAGRKGLSVGMTVFNDHAGTLHYGTTSGHLSIAYYQPLNRAGTSILSVGLEGGFAFHSADSAIWFVGGGCGVVLAGDVGFACQGWIFSTQYKQAEYILYAVG